MFEHIKKVPFSEDYGHGVKIEFVALFDSRVATEAEVKEAIDLRNLGGHFPNVVIMTEQQFGNVFREISDTAATAKAGDIPGQLEAIARQHCHVETLETRKSDSLDFHDISVWGLKAALVAAYEAGHKAGRTSK